MRSSKSTAYNHYVTSFVKIPKYQKYHYGQILSTLVKVHVNSQGQQSMLTPNSSSAYSSSSSSFRVQETRTNPKQLAELSYHLVKFTHIQ